MPKANLLFCICANKSKTYKEYNKNTCNNGHTQLSEMHKITTLYSTMHCVLLFTI